MQFTEVTLPDGVEEIVGSEHLTILENPTAKGRYWYRMDDIKLSRPFVVIDKSNGQVRSETLASRQDVANWFNNIIPSYVGEDTPEPMKPDASNIVLEPSEIAAFTAPPVAEDLVERDATKQRILEISEMLATQLGMERSERTLPTFPADLVRRLVQEKITKTDVEYLVGVFQQNVDIERIREKVRSMVVTGEDQTEMMRQCHDLRLTLRDYRLSLVKMIDLSKDEHHRRWQVHTGYKRHVVDLFKEEEAFLEHNEKFAQRKKEERLQGVRDFRKAALEALGCESLPDLDLGKLKDDAWQAILSAERTAAEFRQREKERLENERIEREEKATRTKGRINLLSQIGLNFNGVDTYAFGSVTVRASYVEEAANADFDIFIDDLKTMVEAERYNREQIATQIKRLNEIGIAWNGTAYHYSGFLDTITIEAAELAGLNGTFEAKLAEWQERISKDIGAKADSDRRKERISSISALGFVASEASSGYELEGVEPVTFSDLLLDASAWTAKYSAITARVSELREAARLATQKQAETEATAAALRVASDRQKFTHLASHLEDTINGLYDEYSFVDERSQDLFSDICGRLREVVSHVRTESDKLALV